MLVSVVPFKKTIMQLQMTLQIIVENNLQSNLTKLLDHSLYFLEIHTQLL